MTNTILFSVALPFLFSMVLPAIINLFFKRNTSTTDTCHHHPLLGLGLGLVTTDQHRSPYVLESAMLKPNSAPPPPTEKGFGTIHDLLSGVQGLASCTESLGFESSDEIHNNGNCSGDEKDNNTNNNNNNYDDVVWRRKAEGRGKVRSFPPPLPSLNRNGQPSFYLRPVRKDGRLELTEVRLHRSEILHAWRHNGRLTLSLVPDQEDDEEEVVEEEEEEEEIEKEEEEEEERFGEWKFPGVGRSEALRSCHEMVNQQQQQHHHHHVHRDLGLCGISIV